jgi:ACR3 family arsenite efflux pump ArsB
MATLVQNSPAVVSPKRLNFFERYLTIWVALCMAAGLAGV